MSTSNNNGNDKMIIGTHSVVISGPNHTLLWPLNATPGRAIGYGWPRASSEATHTRTIKESAVAPYFNHENVDIEPCFIFCNCNSRNCVFFVCLFVCFSFNKRKSSTISSDSRYQHGSFCDNVSSFLL